jgi:hypothetical protein
VSEDSAIRSFNNSQGLEIESRVHFANLKLALWGLDFGFTSGFVGRVFEVLLEVWRAPFDLFSESFDYKKKTELVQISIQMRIYDVGGRADVLPSAPGESVFKQD